MDSTTFHGTTRRPAFIEGDDGLASLADMEAGFSGDHYRLLSRSSYYNPSSNWRNSSSIVSFSPKSARFYVANCEDNHNPYFLEACFLCKKPLGDNRDIFMYRGDTPFCSEECRQEQIEIDEAKEKNWNLSSSMKAIRNDQKKSTSTNKNENYPVRTGAVAAA